MQDTQETQVWSLGPEDPLPKEMATHSNILAWKIPWTEEPGGLQFKKSQKWVEFKLVRCEFALDENLMSISGAYSVLGHCLFLFMICLGNYKSPSAATDTTPESLTLDNFSPELQTNMS